ncbi:unnamed protein product, partial [marine sediment metagenome]
MLVIYILIIYNIEAYKNKGDNMKKILKDIQSGAFAQ